MRRKSVGFRAYWILTNSTVSPCFVPPVHVSGHTEFLHIQLFRYALTQKCRFQGILNSYKFSCFAMLCPTSACFRAYWILTYSTVSPCFACSGHIEFLHIRLFHHALSHQCMLQGILNSYIFNCFTMLCPTSACFRAYWILTNSTVSPCFGPQVHVSGPSEFL